MSYYKRHFTIEEAKALVPDVKARFVKIFALLDEIRAEPDSGGKPMNIQRGNGHGPIVQTPSPKAAEVHAEIAAIVESGVVIKDLSAGLVDFPHYLNGDQAHEVFLCYLVSEETVGFWHEIDAGFAGRTSL
jgi:hypothetical protein